MIYQKEKNVKDDLLVKEINVDKKDQKEPNFILGDWRKAILANEILSQLGKKDIEITVRILNRSHV